jgi:myo-inositol-1(or 4)-monophosphatase
MAGLPDWGVCVALLADNKPVLGVVHAPALGATYAASLGQGATRNAGEIRTRAPADGPPRIAGPKPMLEALAKVYAFDAQPKVPSLALRLARIAEGSLDGGLISPDSRDWDLAAADLILSEAGGTVTTLAGDCLVFNRVRPVHATLVAAGHGTHPALLAAANAMRDHAFSRR